MHRNHRRLLRPLQEFMGIEAASGVVLMICAALALAWANSPWAGSYERLFHTEIAVVVGELSLRASLLHWINDGLMAIFFFVVGLEIKRELFEGELSSARKAALPVAAALGGMALPALIYLAFTAGGPGAAGWGVPMATDIAFALGVLALLGDRVPPALKVFVAAFAIADDIGAVVVIALFYSTDIDLRALAIGLCVLLLALVANWRGVRQPLIYALLGVVLWIEFFDSGVHATVAGLLLALTIPDRARIEPADFLARGREVLGRFGEAGDETGRKDAVHTLERACEQVQAPSRRIEHALQPWVSFVVMPLFALANAGVPLHAGAFAELGQSIALGIFFGLVIGKPLGVTLASWLAVRAGLGAAPEATTWRQLQGAGWLGGVGFTMALFIAGLAFPDPAQLATAKLAILSASLLAGLVGAVVLRTAAQAAGGEGARTHADEPRRISAAAPA